VLNRRRLIIELMNSKFRFVKLNKDMFFRRKSTINTADSDELSAKKVIEMPLESSAVSIQASTAESNRMIGVSTDADFNTAGSTEASTARTLGMSHRFGLISYIIGQLKMNRNMSTMSSADVTDKKASDIAVDSVSNNILKASMVGAKSPRFNIRDTSTNEINAPMLSARAAHASTSKNEKTELLAILCCWDYPTLADGVLCISQANTINYENEILEVI